MGLFDLFTNEDDIVVTPEQEEKIRLENNLDEKVRRLVRKR